MYIYIYIYIYTNDARQANQRCKSSKSISKSTRAHNGDDATQASEGKHVQGKQHKCSKSKGVHDKTRVQTAGIMQERSNKATQGGHGEVDVE